jgi:hypothetical protein
MTGKGFVQCSALGNVVADLREHFPEQRMGSLLLKDLQGFEQWHAALEQVGKLSEISGDKLPLDTPPQPASRQPLASLASVLNTEWE